MKRALGDNRPAAIDDETLRRLIAEGRAGGEPVDGEAAMKRLRDKYAAMIAAKAASPARS